MNNTTTTNYDYYLDMIAGLNNAINDVHTINNNGFSVSDVSAFGKYEKVNHKVVKSYKTVSDFIAGEYITISGGIIKAIRNTMYISKSGKVIIPNYDSLKDIFKDELLKDIQQETALFMLENVDSITDNNDGTFNISNIIIGLCKHIRNFLYKHKIQIDKRIISCIDYDTDTDNDISFVVNEKSLIQYFSDIVNNTDCDTINHVLDIVQDVKHYIQQENKEKQATAICNVLDCLVGGVKKKDICKKLHISAPTLIKYHNEIKRCYNMYVFDSMGYFKPHKNNLVLTAETPKIFINDRNMIYSSYVDNMAEISAYRLHKDDTTIEEYNHNRKQDYYNSIWSNIELKYYAKYSNYSISKVMRMSFILTHRKQDAIKRKAVFMDTVKDKSYFLETRF